MRYDAVLFDLDGTLADSGPGIFDSLRHLMDQIGESVPDDETMRRFIGPSLHDSLAEHYNMSGAERERAVTIYREYYVRQGIYDAVVYRGIPNLLRQLKAAGVYLAVATGKPTSSARILLEHLGLTRFFDSIIGADGDHEGSDKTQIVRAALPAKYEHAVLVGDRLFDVEAAGRLNIDVIGASWGYGSVLELTTAGADAIAATPQEAAQILLGAELMPVQGFFISVEGMDKSGKTTQMNVLASHIRNLGYDVRTTREPGGTPISEDIRSIVLDPEKTVCAETEALLYAAARAQHVRDVIRPGVAEGSVVLCDRFVDSSIAYQGAGRELGIERVAQINAFAIGETMPDLTLLLVVDAQTSFLRRSSATTLDRLERAGEAFFGRVYDAYAKLAQMYPERIRCIDAQQSIEGVTAEACAQVDRLLRKR